MVKEEQGECKINLRQLNYVKATQEISSINSLVDFSFFVWNEYRIDVPSYRKIEFSVKPYLETHIICSFQLPETVKAKHWQCNAAAMVLCPVYGTALVA